MTTAIVEKIVCLIRQERSPEQAAEYLRREHIVSLHHETIYQLIYADKLSEGTLYQHLRVLRKNYRKRYGSYDSRGKIKNRVCIEARPTVVGHCHVLVIGRRHNYRFRKTECITDNGRKKNAIYRDSKIGR